MHCTSTAGSEAAVAAVVVIAANKRNYSWFSQEIEAYHGHSWFNLYKTKSYDEHQYTHKKWENGKEYTHHVCGRGEENWNLFFFFRSSGESFFFAWTSVNPLRTSWNRYWAGNFKSQNNLWTNYNTFFFAVAPVHEIKWVCRYTDIWTKPNMLNVNIICCAWREAKKKEIDAYGW